MCGWHVTRASPIRVHWILGSTPFLRKFAHHCSWSHHTTLGGACFTMVSLDTLRIITLIAFAVGFMSGDGTLWNFQALWWHKAFWSVERQGCRKIWLARQSIHHSMGLVNFCFFLHCWSVSTSGFVSSSTFQFDTWIDFFLASLVQCLGIPYLSAMGQGKTPLSTLTHYCGWWANSALPSHVIR